jgi:hypothetical protein
MLFESVWAIRRDGLSVTLRFRVVVKLSQHFATLVFVAFNAEILRCRPNR